MALVVSDRIKETTTTTGTGTYTLAGAVTGFETFTANLSNGDTTYYACSDGTDFEVGLGTFTSSGTTLARTTILASSNSNNAVSWSSGTRTIFCTLPAAKAVFLDGSDDLTLVGASGNIVFDKSDDALEFADNVKAVFGTGSDLEIYHNGTHSIIRDGGTGDLELDGSTVRIKNAGRSKDMLVANQGGSVELYHDNSKKLETTATGATVTGTLVSDVVSIADGSSTGDRLTIGTSDDFFIYHANQTIIANTNGSGPIKIQAKFGEQSIVANQDAGVELYYNNSKVFETASTGVTIEDPSSSSASKSLRIIGKRDDANDSFAFSGKLMLAVNRTQQLVDTNKTLGIIGFGGNHTNGTVGNILYSSAITGVSEGDFNSATDMPSGLAFFTGSTGRDPDTPNVHVGTERMRINKDGNVGIGTTSPAVPLDVVGQVRTTSGSVDLRLLPIDASNAGIIGTYSNDALVINTNSAERVRIDTSGNVGIGTTTPSAPLDVSGNAEITGTLTAGEVSATTLDIGGTNITSTAAELNILDGVTATTAELNIMDGVTSTTAELNILDGVTATATEINKLDGVTATTTELNYVDVTTLGTVQASKAVTADVNGDVLFPDNEVLKFGTGGDLRIFHDGTNNIFRGDSNPMYVQTDGTIFLTKNNNAETMAKFIGDGAAELYHNNVKKFETTSDGATVTGNATISSTADNGPVLNLISNDPVDAQDFTKEASISFFAENDASESVSYAQISLVTRDVSDGSEDGRVELRLNVGGVADTRVFIFDRDKLSFTNAQQLEWLNYTGSNSLRLNPTTLTATRDISLPDATGTVLTTGNSDTPTTTTSSSDADFVLVDDGGTMKKITPSNLGITSGGASKGFAVAMAIAL